MVRMRGRAGPARRIDKCRFPGGAIGIAADGRNARGIGDQRVDMAIRASDIEHEAGTVVPNELSGLPSLARRMSATSPLRTAAISIFRRSRR